MQEPDGVRIDHSFNIEVMFDSEVNVWVASCDQIGLATEEELTLPQTSKNPT